MVIDPGSDNPRPWGGPHGDAVPPPDGDEVVERPHSHAGDDGDARRRCHARLTLEVIAITRPVAVGAMCHARPVSQRTDRLGNAASWDVITGIRTPSLESTRRRSRGPTAASLLSLRPRRSVAIGAGGDRPVPVWPMATRRSPVERARRRAVDPARGVRAMAPDR